MKPMSVEWDDEQPAGYRLHDDIWFNAIREYRKLQLRKEFSSTDTVLDGLIRIGLIDQTSNQCTPQINQVLRYSAVLAGRMTARHLVVEEQVSSTSSGLGNR